MNTPAVLTPTQDRVLAAVRAFKAHEGCGATSRELREWTALKDLHPTQISYQLQRLEKLGLVHRYGAGRFNASCWHPDPAKGDEV